MTRERMVRCVGAGLIAAVFTVGSRSAGREQHRISDCKPKPGIEKLCATSGMPILCVGDHVVIIYMVGLEALSAREKNYKCDMDVVNHAEAHKLKICVVEIPQNDLAKAKVVWPKSYSDSNTNPKK
jgi:hypothetical protein